ncbi:hypothetical protein SteCoe_7437 [Stentor coeruleus]|uniref:Uncharacterized protein n=1 Tax=Stentor coeruleus TaxID=5963 RepID=A0A1R2CMN9_9CILI|nr:hypothetical protein SteCoe_7437 [Stentor coeruleus]
MLGLQNISQHIQKNQHIEPDSAPVRNKAERTFTIDYNYEVDDEPLIQISTDKAPLILENLNESMVSDALCAKIENYLSVIEYEEKQRKNAETRLNELMTSYTIYLDSTQKSLEKYQEKIDELESEKNKLLYKSNELAAANEKLKAEIQRLKDKIDLQYFQLQAKSIPTDEALFYKNLLEKSNAKFQVIAEKVESNNINDPIEILIKEKDQKIIDLTSQIDLLTSQIKDLTNIPTEIELKLQDMRMIFTREKEYIYTVNGVRIVIGLSANSASSLSLRRIGGFVNAEDLARGTPHKRSVSDKVKSPTPLPLKKMLMQKKLNLAISSNKKSS